jgi:hypothetical protein
MMTRKRAVMMPVMLYRIIMATAVDGEGPRGLLLVLLFEFEAELFEPVESVVLCKIVARYICEFGVLTRPLRSLFELSALFIEYKRNS